MAFHVLTPKDGLTRFKRDHPWTWRQDAVEAIHRYAEFRFTADGRFYSMALGGESIGDLMRADGCPDFREHPQVRSELCAVAGAIVICDDAHGDEGELLTYCDRQELIDAWRELHQISGVQMSDADAETLDDRYPGSDEDDED